MRQNLFYFLFQKVDFVKQRFFDSDFYILPKDSPVSTTEKVPDLGAALIYSLRHAITFSIYVIV